MRQPRFTIAGVMIAVAFVSLDCAVALVSGLFAGGLALGLALQVGIFGWLSGRGRRRRFWTGFELTGLTALVAYEVGRRVAFRATVWWPMTIFGNVRVFLDCLPDSISHWFIRHVYLIDPAGNLTTAQNLVMFEVAYGPPMILLAILGGLVWASLRPRTGDPAREDRV